MTKNTRIPPEEACDLDPNKICDNCCKCIDEGAAYRVLVDDVDPDSMRVFNVSDPDAVFNDPVEPLDIDPELAAEWEEKLRASGLDEDEGAEEDAPEREITMKGIRKRKKHVSHLPEA